MNERSRESDGLAAMLAAHTQGDAQATDRLMSLVYDRIRGLARRRFLGERPGHTLEPTAVVHEVYLRLVGEEGVDQRSRAEFFAIAARLLREILVDYARRHRAQKRGGHLAKVTLEKVPVATRSNPVDLLALDDALVRLQALNERQGRVVELKFFAGLTTVEVADLLGVSERTVRGDWELARAWLAREMS